MPVEKIANKAVEPEDEEQKQLTLKNILDDKEMSRGFNVWMEGQGKQELMAKMLKGELEGADMESLAEERQNFLERTAQEKEMGEALLSEGNLQVFIKNSPELTRINELIGEDGIREALATVFHEKALAPGGDTTHGDLFEDYTKWVDKTGKFMDKKKEWDSFLKKSNLTPEEAEKVRGVADLQEITGVTYSTQKDPTGEQAVSQIDKGLATGAPVPIVIGDGKPPDNYKHYVLVTGSDDKSPKTYTIHDPWSGITYSSPEKNVKDGTLNIAGWNQVTAVENPSPLP
jgi:hypothetical protein